MKEGLTILDLLPNQIKIGAAAAEKVDNFSLIFEGKTGVKIEKTVGVTTDKINLFMGKMKIGSGGEGDVFVPFLGGFGVIDPGAGQELKTKIDGVVKKTAKAETPVGTEGSNHKRPV